MTKLLTREDGSISREKTTAVAAGVGGGIVAALTALGVHVDPQLIAAFVTVAGAIYGWFARDRASRD